MWFGTLRYRFFKNLALKDPFKLEVWIVANLNWISPLLPTHPQHDRQIDALWTHRSRPLFGTYVHTRTPQLSRSQISRAIKFFFRLVFFSFIFLTLSISTQPNPSEPFVAAPPSPTPSFSTTWKVTCECVCECVCEVSVTQPALVNAGEATVAENFRGSQCDPLFFLTLSLCFSSLQGWSSCCTTQKCDSDLERNGIGPVELEKLSFIGCS